MDKIILNEMDSTFKDEIAAQAGAESFMRCFTCGTCTASCPVAEVHDEYDPRRIIRMAVLGMREEVLSSDILWMCSRCYTCYALCPQDVKFSDVVSILRDMAIKDGRVPSERAEKAKDVDRQVQKLRCLIIENKLNPDEDKKQDIEKLVEELTTNKW